MKLRDTGDNGAPHQTVCFNADLVGRYGGRGPRYTSYPTALQFNEEFGADDYRTHTAISNGDARPLSLYVHIPFCESLCYYCACNKIVTRNQERMRNYLDHLNAEIQLQAALFDSERIVEQLHFGGGTPTYLSHDQLRELMAALGAAFQLENGEKREFSIEVDPRSVDRQSVDLLADLGFNRISIGIQDFDPDVQLAVNRIQSETDVAQIVTEARDRGFKSISFDLIYGLPHQSADSFECTLDRVIDMRPDRLAIYNYAHLPNRFKGQRMIHESDLPLPAAKLEILKATIERLTAAGYHYIGMDHFALPDDELVHAQRNGTLQRNFQGYSTHSDCDLIGLGASAIGKIGNAIAQNAHTTAAYEELIGAGHLAVIKGVAIDADDRVRAGVIQGLMCHDFFDYAQFEAQHGVKFDEYFGSELERLYPLSVDGLIELEPDGIRITPKGRLLLRSIAMIFDRHLQIESNDRRFSRAI